MSLQIPAFIQQFKQAYFLGIGGIGMSAIARYFNQNGMPVYGYDKTPSPLTDELQAENMQVNFEDKVEAIPLCIRENLTQTLFVITPAIPANSIQRNYLHNAGVDLKKRSEILGIISRDTFCIAVAGTHGKTTTSTLIAHILKTSKVNFTAFLGGISSNYNSNYVYEQNGINVFADRQITVVEADEFDRSFHRLSPDIAVVTAIDADHLDIYHTAEAFHEAFEIFISKIESGGTVILNEKLRCTVANHVLAKIYGNQENADFRVSNIRSEMGNFYFDWQSKTGVNIHNMEAGLPGIHNIENACAALGATVGILGLDKEKAATAIQSYRGAKRRFEYIVKSSDYIVIDDYAHHPEELNAFIHSVKKLYPSQKITGIFQPHLFSRTHDFGDGFAAALEPLDEIILMEIYPARELPIPGINSTWLLQKIQNKQKKLLDSEQILQQLKVQKPPVLLIMGAGDIDRIVPKIKEVYSNG